MDATPVFPAGAPIWMEIESSDLTASKTFYETLFGWTSVSMGPEFGDYVSFSLDGLPVGGGIPNRSGDTDSWIVYLATADAATTATAIRDAEGDVFLGPHRVGEMGTMVMAMDSHGSRVGAWQPADNRGFGVLAEVGAPAWFELHTSGYDESLQFYRQAFGWETATMADDPGFRYTQLMIDGAPYAGLFDATADLPAGAPGGWLVYLRVADTDASVIRAVELGATVVEPAVDTPFGRLATMLDPTGARFRIVA